ncbi:MAG TPA: GxxExxY protein [Chloroflexia bacterium]|nr:GxxExxY protein [Chloroflexia bacterium]
MASGDIDGLASAVIGAAIEVHRTLGPGFLESVYEESLCYELELRSIPFQRQPKISVIYKGRNAGDGRMDLLVDSKLMVELKSVDALASVHTAQLLSYLRAGSYQAGLLFNFNVKLLKEGGIKRLLYGPRLTSDPPPNKSS